MTMHKAHAQRVKLLVALVCLLGAISITLITALEQRAMRSRDNEVTVSMAVNEFNALQGLPWKADVASGGSPALAAELMTGAQRRLAGDMARLRRDHPVAQLAAVAGPMRRSIALLNRVRELAAHRRDMAAGYLQYKGQPTADRVVAELLSAEQSYRARARASLTAAWIGATASIVLLIGIFSLLYVRLTRARSRSERLARENERLLQASREEATTDALTGLRNRRALMDDLQARLPNRRAEHRLMLAIFDLDGFKQYNDTFGHGAGDALLTRLGERLATTVQGIGTAYRMGGDEFCVLAETEGEEREAVARLAAAALSETGEGFSVGCSYGVAIIPDDASASEQALAIADQRMYTQKTSGRASAGRQSADVLVKVLEEQSPDLEHHILDVANLAELTAERLGLPSSEVSRVRLAAELHDVGKAAIPDAILDKPGPLDEHEWSFMRRHTIIGERIVLAAPSLAHTAPLIRSSHERVDGAGYPDGLRAADIPVGSRILAVCDAFAAMTSARPYQAAMSVDAALTELRRCAGSQFDATIVEVFCELIADQQRSTAPRNAGSELPANAHTALRITNHHSRWAAN